MRRDTALSPLSTPREVCATRYQKALSFVTCQVRVIGGGGKGGLLLAGCRKGLSHSATPPLSAVCPDIARGGAVRRCAGADGVAADDGTGLTFAPASTEALLGAVSRAMGMLFEEPGRWSRMQARCMEVAPRSCWGRHAERFEALLTARLCNQ